MFYLEFQMERGNQKIFDLLFERCLVAGVIIQEIWGMYTQFLNNLWREDACTALRNQKSNREQFTAENG